MTMRLLTDLKGKLLRCASAPNSHFNAAPPLLPSNSYRDQALKQYVQSKYPEITQSATSHWKRVCCLREYVYQRTPWAMRSQSQALQRGEQHWQGIYSGQIGLADHFQFMRELKGGHFCGTTAAILTALAQSFGYEAWYLGCGLPYSTRTHAQTLIKISEGGRSLYSLHDPSINISYTYSDGRTPIDYFQILTLLRQGRDGEISRAGSFRVGENPRAIVLGFKDDFEDRDPQNPASYGWLIDPEDYTVSQISADVWVVRSPRSLKNFENYYAVWYRPIFAEVGLGGNSLHINLLPFQIEGASPVVSQQLLKQALDIAGWQSPLPRQTALEIGAAVPYLGS